MGSLQHGKAGRGALSFALALAGACLWAQWLWAQAPNEATLAGAGAGADGGAGARHARAWAALLATCDPLERAHAVQQLGDLAVTQALTQKGESADVAVVLAAVRAAPFLIEPQRALPALIERIGARDPDVAPSAAAAVVSILQHLVTARQEPGPIDAATLDDAKGALERLAARAHVRADLRLDALQAAELIAALRDRL